METYYLGKKKPPWVCVYVCVFGIFQGCFVLFVISFLTFLILVAKGWGSKEMMEKSPGK